jgi:hypothetical protein
MRYVNNWISQLTADFSSGSTALPIGASSLALLGDGQYRLTLVNSISPVEQTAWEIIQLTMADGVATVVRGIEGTAPRAWPLGSFIYCAVTAGGMNQLATQIADLITRVTALEAAGPGDGGDGGGDGGGPLPSGALTAANGDALTDTQNNQLVGG